MRLDTADQLLCYMNQAPIGPGFVSEGRGVSVRHRNQAPQIRVHCSRRPLVRDEAQEGGVTTDFHRRAGAGVDARQQERAGARPWRAGARRRRAASARHLVRSGRARHASRGAGGPSSLRRRTPPRDNDPYQGRSQGDPYDPRGRGPAHTLASHAGAIPGERRRTSLPQDRGKRPVCSRRPAGMGVDDAPGRDSRRVDPHPRPGEPTALRGARFPLRRQRTRCAGAGPDGDRPRGQVADTRWQGPVSHSDLAPFSGHGHGAASLGPSDRSTHALPGLETLI